MSKRCYYDVLGCQKTASIEEIKGAYRKLAKEFHPDRNQGDDGCEHKFKEVAEAYEVLKDGDKRAAYDRFGHAAFEQGGRPGANGFGFDFASSFTDVFDDLFGEFMGGRKARRQNRGARPALQSRDLAGRSLPRQERAIARQCGGGLRRLRRHRRGSGHQARAVPGLLRARARCAPSRASSPSNARARIARARAASCARRAKPAAAQVTCRKNARCRWPFPPASKKAHAFV